MFHSIFLAENDFPSKYMRWRSKEETIRARSEKCIKSNKLSYVPKVCEPTPSEDFKGLNADYCKNKVNPIMPNLRNTVKLTLIILQ